MGTFRANIYGPLDRGMVTLQLCRWQFSRKGTRPYVADFTGLNLKSIKKEQKFAF